MRVGRPITADDVAGAKYLSRFIVEAADPVERYTQVVRVGGLLYGLGGFLAGVMGLLPSQLAEETNVIFGISLLCLAVSMLALGAPRRIAPPILLAFAFLPVGTITLASFAWAKEFGTHGALMYVWVAAFGFCVFRKRVGVTLVAVMAAAYAWLIWAEGTPLQTGVSLWIFVVATLTIAGVMVGWAFHDASELAIAERAARKEVDAARAELATFNARLANQVDEQLGELERFGRLRRFLSPAVADALLGADSEAVFAPHRREISVVFVDLRGFTPFSMNAEPEEVVSLLTEYYDQIGQLVNRYGASVGSFSGDGVMAYFNDPVPCPDPAGTAVDMALAARQALTDAAQSWRSRGFDLSFGIGIALGYATLGTIGFAERQDYTAVGTVVNLAARLCAAAPPGHILIDPKTLAAVDWVSVEEMEPITAKGFRDPVRPFSVVARKPVTDESLAEVTPLNPPEAGSA